MVTQRIIRYKLSKTFLRVPLQWFRHKKLRKTDILVASYPRSGSTWLRFLLFELLMGYPATFETINKEGSAVSELIYCQNAPMFFQGNGRLIKTHERYRTEYFKAIYLVRDVRDVVISEYNYARWLNVCDDPLEQYIDQFLDGNTNGYGNWNNHVLSWYQSPLMQTDDLHFIKFEDMLINGSEAIQKLLGFLNVNLTVEVINDALKHNSFTVMKKKETAARETVLKNFREDVDFVRRGVANQWHDVLTPSQIQKIEQRCAEAMDLLGYTRYATQ